MKRSSKVTIAVACLFLLVFIGGTLYVINRIENISSASSLEQLLANSSQDKLAVFNNPKAPEPNPDTTIPQGTVERPAVSEAPNIVEDNVLGPNVEENKQAQATAPSPKPASPPASSSLDNKIAGTLEKEAGRPIDTSDMLKAGYILMSKLSNDEINFLMGFSDKKYTSDELKELRKLLLSKLNAEDVETLRALANKYGRNLYILDPNIPIK